MTVAKNSAQDFIFADDYALSVSNQWDMQLSMDLFATVCNNFGLTLSFKKTEVMYQPAPGTPNIEPYITINFQKLASATKFLHLRSTLPKIATLDEPQGCCLLHYQGVKYPLLENRCYKTQLIFVKIYQKLYQTTK